MVSHEHYNSPPLYEDYSEYGRQVLAGMGLSVPTEPSVMGLVWTEVLALDTAGRCGGTWDEVSAILGVVAPDDSSYRLGRRLGANTVPGAVHSAFQVGALVVPPLKEEAPAPLSKHEDILLRGLAAGYRRNELRRLLPRSEATRGRVEHALQDMFARARVRTSTGLMYWAHEQGYFPSLRYHPEPLGYYRDMSIMSRARLMLDRVFPDSVVIARDLPNQVVYAMVAGMPEALPRQGRRDVDRATHSKRLMAWLEHEPDALQKWADANGTDKKALNMSRTSLINLAKEGLTFDGLHARAIEQLEKPKTRRRKRSQ